MKFLRNLGTRLDKKGRKQSWAVYFCPFCLQEVEKQLGLGERCKSCGCVRYKLTSESHKGKKKTSQHLQNISKALKKGYKEGTIKLSPTVFLKGVKHPDYGKPRSDVIKQKISLGNKGKIVSEETRQKIRKAHLGMEVPEETRQKISIATKGKNNPMYGVHRFGEDSPGWQGGISDNPYPLEFNKGFKKFIYERDNYQCQYPNCTEIHNRLHAHHIDYDKKNNIPENLISLGDSCHAKTIGKKNRQYWTEYYQNIMINRILECLL